MNRAIFRDEQNQKFFEENGYIKLSLLNEKEIVNLIEFCITNIPSFEHGFSTTFAFEDRNLKEMIKQFLEENLASKLTQILIDYKPLVYSYLCKTKNTKNELELHQDWSFIDETTGLSSLSVWCPLVETSPTNGMLSVFPKTHLLPRFIRASPTSQTISKKILNGYKHLIKEIPTKVGEVIIFDSALLHSSAPNFSSENRYVAGLLAIPKESKGLLYYKNLNNEFDCYETDSEFYISNNPFIVNSGRYINTQEPLKLDKLNDSFIRLFGSGINNEIELSKSYRSWWKNFLKV